MERTKKFILKKHEVRKFANPFHYYYYFIDKDENIVYELIDYDYISEFNHFRHYGTWEATGLVLDLKALEEARKAFLPSLKPPRWPFPLPVPAEEGTRLPTYSVDIDRLTAACKKLLAEDLAEAHVNSTNGKFYIYYPGDGPDLLCESISGPGSRPYVGQLFAQRKAICTWLYRIKIGRMLELPEIDSHLADLMAILEEARDNLEQLKKLNPEHFDVAFMAYILLRLTGAWRLEVSGDIKHLVWQRVIINEQEFIKVVSEEVNRINKISKKNYLCYKELNHIKSSKPSRKWLKAAESAINDHDLAACLLRELEAARDLMEKDPDGIDTCLREFIWASAFLPAAKVVPLLGDIAELAYRKTPNGIAKESIGNACVWALQNLATKEAAAQLVRILNRVHYPKVRKTVDKALRAVADKLGISRHELEEIAAPDHGLADGKRRIELDGGAAVISLRQNRLELSWENEKGQRTKTPPASLKKKSPESIREIKALLKQIEKDVAIQRRRLESMYLQNIEIPGENWLHQYVNHGTVGLLARRLLWQARFPDGETVTVLPASGQCETMDGTAVDCSKAIIRLWHPLFSTSEEVNHWRRRLRELEIVQPFRQAWREVYLLTDAERETHTYTNRWAGHIVRQHQMLNLAQQNGWRAVHRMWVDAPNDEPWRIHLPAFGLYAEFWVQGAGDRDNPPVLDNMAYKCLLTDRVRFCRLDENARWGRGEDIPLEEVPPIIFSEIMRHCDLFVSVASIARDPYWMDAGPDADHPSDWDHYWRMQHEARIRESGRRRREILAAILPGLARAEAFSLRENHLHVRGRRHDYLIHLDSAGVLKLPERRHICIVPSSRMKSDSRRIALPDEGDEILSLILSKALLLADDDRIKDPVILGQLEEKE